MLKPICIFILLTAICSNILAQQKVGALASDEVIKQMPETVKANTILVQYQDSLIKAAEKFEAAYYKKMDEWNWCDDCPPLPDSLKKARRKELIEMYSTMQAANSLYQELARQKAAELYAPIRKKFDEEVKQVAIENYYGCVLDLCDTSGLPFPSCKDITDLVVAKLGL